MGAAKAFDFAQASMGEADKRENQIRVARACLFISRTTVRSVMQRELKQYGIPDIKLAESVQECCDDMKANPGSLLVIDWECGEQKVIKALRAAQGSLRVDTRPIYFIALDVSDRVVAIAGEYNVTQIHTGEISQSQIVKNLDELLNFSLVSEACHEAFRQVAELRKQGQWEASAAVLQPLCMNEPNNLRAAVEYGFSLCEAGKISEAESWLKDTARQFPGDLRTKHLLARCAMKSGRFAEAEGFLKEANLISPQNAERLVDLGRVLLGMDRVKEALGKFNEALKIDKDFQEAKVGKAQCDLLSGHLNEAMKLLGQIESPQELASIFNGAAILAIRHQHFKQGLSLYKTAITMLQKDQTVVARVFFNMGLGLVKWGKGETALAAFERATSLDPGLRKAKHNHSVLQAIVRRGGSLAAVGAQLQQLDALPVEPMKGKALPMPTPQLSDAAELGELKNRDADGLVEEVDDSYFQSLISG